jgi:hypothetical protein
MSDTSATNRSFHFQLLSIRVLYFVTFRILTSRDALVRFQSSKDNNCSADRPLHGYLLIARVPRTRMLT